jgi:hypothetical protein
MKSTLGKVSAIMILLVFLIASILVLNIAKAQNETGNESFDVNYTNISLDVLENVTGNDTVDNGTVSEDFVLGRIFENISLSETVEIVTSIANETIEQNETLNETSNETSPSNETEPIFIVNLGSGRITRGEIVVLNANVLNTGSLAKGVYLDWILPEEFEIFSGNQRENCGDLVTDGSCYSEISVMIDPSTEIGLNKVKIVVNYEE